MTRKLGTLNDNWVVSKLLDEKLNTKQVIINTIDFTVLCLEPNKPFSGSVSELVEKLNSSIINYHTMPVTKIRDLKDYFYLGSQKVQPKELVA